MNRDPELTYHGYYYVEGPAYIPDEYDGSEVVGQWTKDNIQVPTIFGKPVQYAVKSAHIPELDDGRFLVRRYGMNDTWSGGRIGLLGSMTTWTQPIADFENRIEYVNQETYRNTIRRWIEGQALALIRQ